VSTGVRRAISVVVPTRNEASTIAAALAPLREPEVLEVIVVDGGSTDETASLAAPFADRVLEAAPCRAKQMNLGAAAARGEILFFLHADTLVPRGFARAIARACESAIGGRFDVTLDARGIAFRVIERAINWRSRWSGLFTGDQGLFIRREAFEALGGFPDQPLLEDLELSKRMKRHGTVATLRDRLTTSARRWQRHGTAQTVLLMWSIRARYALGADPAILARTYRDAR
jgi:rSAM/selenodomain-associated transferase 2